MKTIILCLVLFLPASVLVAAPTAKPPSKKIIAGRSIGDLHVGTRLAEVEARRGRSPDGDVSSGRLKETWKVPGGVLEVRADRPDAHTFIVKRVRTTSPSYRTKDGLHVRSQLSEVRTRYPHAEFASDDGGEGPYFFGDDSVGINFEFAAKDGSARCTAILVYQPR